MYRTAVKKNSPHHNLWEKSLKILSTMSFVNEKGKKISTPTIQNWISTIKGNLFENNYQLNRLNYNK